MSKLGTYTGNILDECGYLNTAGRPVDPFCRTNLPRIGGEDLATPLATGVMTAVALWLTAGDLVTSLTFTSGSTAAGTPTNQFAALYSNAAVPALMAQSVDRTSEAWAADTARTFVLATAQRIAKSGIYWAALNVTATTPPTLLGMQAPKPLLTGEVNLAVTSGSGLTATAPATLATPAWTRKVPLCVAQ